MLLAEGCSIVAYDPAAIKRTLEVLPAGPNLRYVHDAYAAAKDADALLILTDWAEFATLDLNRLNKTLRYPIIIDGRNLYSNEVMREHGFMYVSVGRRAAQLESASTMMKAKV
jgi:UDPglucose 6-dehydrogenase